MRRPPTREPRTPPLHPPPPEHVSLPPREHAAGKPPNPRRPRLVRDVHGGSFMDLFDIFPDLPRPRRPATRAPRRTGATWPLAARTRVSPRPAIRPASLKRDVRNTNVGVTGAPGHFR